MIEITNQKYIKMINAYNEEYARLYNQLLDKQKSDSESNHDASATENEVINSIQEWFNKPFSEEYLGITPDFIIDSIENINDAIELGSYAAILCNNDIPDQIKIKLGSFGSKGVQRIEESILKFDWEYSIDDTDHLNDSLVISSYLKLLGEWQYYEGKERLIEKFTHAENPNEIISEAMRTYLCLCGDVTISAIITCLRGDLAKKAGLSVASEYLLIALADIGKNKPSDEVFSCLRDCFRKMKNRVIGAICIGDYGEGRGVQVLKGWLDQHPEENDRQLVSEILSSIKRLGGDISDVQHRLKLTR